MIDFLLVMLAAGVGWLAGRLIAVATTGVYLLMSINEAREDKRLEDEYDQWVNENQYAERKEIIENDARRENSRNR